MKKEYFLTSTNFSSNVFKMISRDFQSMMWVSNMILMIRVTQRNKLWVRTTLQSVFTDGNESSCWFFQYDALSKSKFWVLHNMLLTLKITTHLWKIAQIQRKNVQKLLKMFFFVFSDPRLTLEWNTMDWKCMVPDKKLFPLNPTGKVAYGGKPVGRS